jgi:hypothetical protein
VTTEFKLRSSSRVRFSDDGAYLVSLGRRITLWDVAKGRRAASGPHFADPASADFSPDGRMVAVKNTSGDVLVMSVPALEEVARLSGAGIGEGTPIRFSPDGRHIVDACWGGALMVRDPTDGSMAWRETGHSIFRLACTHDRATWVYDRGQTLVRGWPFDTNAPEAVSSLGAPPGPVAISDDGNRVVAVSGGLQVSERHADRGGWSEPRLVHPAPFDGLDHGLCWGPGGELVYTHQHAVWVFHDLHAAPRAMRVPFWAFDIAISPTGATVAIGGWDAGLVTDWPLELTDEADAATSPDDDDLVTKINELAQAIAKEQSSGPMGS